MQGSTAAGLREELYNNRAATLEEATRVCKEIAWPIAHRLDWLDEAAKQVPRFADASSTIASRFRREVDPRFVSLTSTSSFLLRKSPRELFT